MTIKHIEESLDTFHLNDGDDEQSINETDANINIVDDDVRIIILEDSDDGGDNETDSITLTESEEAALQIDVTEIEKIIDEFNSVENKTLIDELRKSQKIADIIYKNNELNNITRVLKQKYIEHLIDIDIRDEYNYY